MNAKERKDDEERLRKCRFWKDEGASIEEGCAKKKQKLADLEALCALPGLPPTPAPIPVIPPTPAPIPVLPPTPAPIPVLPPTPAPIIPILPTERKIDFKTGCRNKKMTRDKMFLGGYTEMAQWMTSKNIGEPCDIGNSGYNAKRGYGADRSDNRKYGFNRSGVREYCEGQKFNFMIKGAKAKAYEWCCKYGDEIGAELKPISVRACQKAKYFP